MIDYSKELREQRMEIDSMIQKIKKREKNYIGLPEGGIRVTSGGGLPQYFFKPNGSITEKYIPAKDRGNLVKMLQRDYERKVLEELIAMEKRLDVFLRNFDAKVVENIYAKQCEGRRKMVEPLVLSDEAYIQKWLEGHQGEQNPFPEKGIYETEQGEFVRSKSEKIIADTLFKMKVPYRYETRIELDGNRNAYPDFACLNVRLRETKYWEHLGLLGNGDYETKNFEKIETYERNGILIGDELILSFETREHPLRTADIRRKIERFLL